MCAFGRVASVPGVLCLCSGVAPGWSVSVSRGALLSRPPPRDEKYSFAEVGRVSWHIEVDTRKGDSRARQCFGLLMRDQTRHIRMTASTYQQSRPKARPAHLACHQVTCGMCLGWWSGCSTGTLVQGTCDVMWMYQRSSFGRRWVVTGISFFVQLPGCCLSGTTEHTRSRTSGVL